MRPNLIVPAPLEGLASLTFAAAKSDGEEELAHLKAKSDHILDDAEAVLAGLQRVLENARSATGLSPDFDIDTAIARARFDELTFARSIRRLRRLRTALRKAPGRKSVKATASQIIDRVEDWTTRFAETLRDLRWSLMALQATGQSNPRIGEVASTPRQMAAMLHKLASRH